MTVNERSMALLVAVFLVAAALPARAADPAAVARQMLDAAGVKGGLVVHVGCGDGRLTAALHAGDSYLVHGLDRSAEHIAKARDTITARGLYGAVSVEPWPGGDLPYADNLVNLAVVEQGAGVSEAEILRVLCPGGVALVRRDGAWTKTVKPWPKAIDEWTHYLHDASGNAVARDTRVGSPRRVQWMAGPKRSRDHDALASMSAMTSSGGRLFYIFDEGPTSLIHRPARWRLIARGAFNGVLLWKRAVPTWVTHLFYFRSGPVQLPRRLVSVGDRVYVTLGLDAPVSALDAATGKTLHTFEGSAKTEEIIYHNGMLLAVVGDPRLMNAEAPSVYGYWELSVTCKPTIAKSIVAYDARTGKVCWRKADASLAFLAPLSLVALEDKVFFLDNEFLHGVRLADGKEVWRAAFPTEGLFLRNYAPTVVAYDGVVMCLTWNRLHAFAAADGKKLWEHKGAIGFASPGDLFAIDGLAWTIPMTASIWKGNRLGRDGKIATGIPIPKDTFLGNGGKEIWGIDVRTGEVKRTLSRTGVLPGGHHPRCYRNKATERFLICGRRGLEYIDLVGQNHVNNWWVRGLCQYGVMPANGYIYVPPDPCQCFNLIKVNGFCALAAASSLDGIESGGSPVLEKGPAYGRVPPKSPAAASRPAEDASAPATVRGRTWHPPISPAKADEWPTFRGNITRSGSTPSRVPATLKRLWATRLGGRLTASVVAGGRLLICSRDACTVHCLDAETGKPRWRFAAGGRVDSPPTVCGGLCVFGSGDGSVYCLRLSDGALVWRFRAAPVDRRVVADNRLASVWPIHGSTLVQDGVVYAAAGRSSYLDGGIRLFGLDLHSGEKRYATTVAATPIYPGKGGPKADSVGGLPDVLVSDGRLINMRHLQFDSQLALQDAAHLKTLCASTGLLEDAWAHRQNWILGNRGPINSRAHAGRISGRQRAADGAAGKLIAFNADIAYSVKNRYSWLKYDRSLWPASHDGHLHQKYSRYAVTDFPVGVRIAAAKNVLRPGALPKKKRGKAAARDAAPAAGEWVVEEPIQPRAMVLAADVLFLAGWRDAVAIHEKTGRPLDPDHPDPRPPFLWVRSATDGKTLGQYPLEAEPVFDGLAAAYGKLYLAMKDGTVTCWGK